MNGSRAGLSPRSRIRSLFQPSRLVAVKPTTKPSPDRISSPVQQPCGFRELAAARHRLPPWVHKTGNVMRSGREVDALITNVNKPVPVVHGQVMVLPYLVRRAPLCSTKTATPGLVLLPQLLRRCPTP